MRVLSYLLVLLLVVSNCLWLATWDELRLELKDCQSDRAQLMSAFDAKPSGFEAALAAQVCTSSVKAIRPAIGAWSTRIASTAFVIGSSCSGCTLSPLWSPDLHAARVWH